MADANTISRIGGMLKVVYGKLETQFNQKSIVADEFEKDTTRIGGDHFEMAAHVAGNTAGIQASLSDDPTPVAGRQDVEKFKVTDRMLEGAIKVYEADVLNTEGNARAFVNQLDFEVERMMKDLRWHSAVMVFGDGTGTLATVNANTSAATTFVCSTSTGFGQWGCKYLRVGDFVDIWDPTFTTQRNSANGGAGVSVTAINPDTQTVTLSAAQTLTAGDVIVRHNSANKEFQGLYLASDNSSSVTFQNLSRSTYPVIKGSVISGGGSSLSEANLQDVITLIEARSGEEVDRIVASDSQLNQYVSLGQGLKRYMNTNKLDRGFTDLEYMGIPLRKDIWCPPSIVYAYALSTIKEGVVAPLAWSELDGHMLKKIPGYLAYEAIARKIGNYLYEKPSAVGRIDTLAVPNTKNYQY